MTPGEAHAAAGKGDLVYRVVRPSEHAEAFAPMQEYGAMRWTSSRTPVLCGSLNPATANVLIDMSHPQLTVLRPHRFGPIRLDEGLRR